MQTSSNIITGDVWCEMLSLRRMLKPSNLASLSRSIYTSRQLSFNNGARNEDEAKTLKEFTTCVLINLLFMNVHYFIYE